MCIEVPPLIHEACGREVDADRYSLATAPVFRRRPESMACTRAPIYGFVYHFRFVADRKRGSMSARPVIGLCVC